MSDDPSRSSPVAGNNTNSTVSENVTLRIVILAHGNRREDDLYLVLGLDTTLGELKDRIQESLPQRPPPTQQRIIYQGRGLEDTDESLRTILRQDSRAGNSSYVLHLVIRQVSAGSQPTSAASSAVPGQNPLLQARQPQDPRIQLPQTSPHDAHMRIHNQIHQLQHSLQHQQAVNRAQLLQALPHLPIGTPVHPDQARIIRPEHPANLAAGQIQAGGQFSTVPGLASSQNLAANRASAYGQTSPSTNTASAAVQASPQLQGPHTNIIQAGSGQLPNPLVNTTQIRTAVGTDGQHTRTVINGGTTGTTTMTFRITGLNPPNPLDRPSSAPGASPSADAGPDNRTVNPVPGNIQIQAPPPPVPMGFPFPPGLQLPFPVPNIAPILNNPFQQLTAPTSTAQPMAWLLSSPSGPHGIVFAPGHGFFNTAPMINTAPMQPQPTPTQTQNATSSPAIIPQQAQLIVRPQTGPAPPHAPQPGARPQAADLPVAPQPRGHARRAQARPNLDQNEILHFVLNRGWLFLRLYMFVFVFSESGTWRRILMIGAIIIYCALPQQNPLTNTLQVVRRHFDNLIGPPNIAPRPVQQAQQNGQNPDQPGASRAAQAQARSSTSSRRRAPPTPTPEEAARRLLEQQNRRNPNPVIDALYRIEQGVVLFLASLVPGVGERHVRAREEARRIIQEEEQRRLTDHERQPQPAIEEGNAQAPVQLGAHAEGQRTRTEGGPLPDGWKTATQLHEETYGPQATSSGVDRNGDNENEGVRSRTTNSGE